MNIYDSAIEALLNHEPELAMELIRETQQMLSQRVIEFPPEESIVEMENSTDFLHFSGWEAA